MDAPRAAWPRISVDLAICTYNNAAGLDEVLQRIAALRIPADVACRVLVVDNASTDETARVAARHAAGSPLPLRYVHEPVQGLTPARLRAFHETDGEWIAYVDDDNLLEPGWLEAIAASLRSRPDAGGVGGRVQLAWDAAAPGWAADFGFCFAEQELGAEPRDVEALVGAGMALRREALLACGWASGPLLADRIGKSLISGGDVEIAVRVRGAGYRLCYNPMAVLLHRMPAGRATRRYLWRMNYALGATAVAVSLLAWSGDDASWRESVRSVCVAKLREAWAGLWWSLRRRRKLTAAVGWLCFALGYRRGVRDLRRAPQQRRALMGKAAPAPSAGLLRAQP